MGMTKMNKLIVDSDDFVIDNVEAELIISVDSVDITSTGNNKIFINKDTINLNITLEDDSTLELYIFSKNKIGDNRIVINQGNNTSIVYKESFVSSTTVTEYISNVIMGNNNKSDIKIRCIANKDQVDLDVLIVALKDTFNNEAVEDIKGINNGGTIKMLPNMEISSNEIEANHYMTIGDIDKNYLFYLKSMGISEQKAKKLILNGFLKSIYKDTTIIGGEFIE